MAINEKTCLCRSFRVLRCWVSPTTKQELVRIRVDKWMDIGQTTATLYWKDNDNVVVVNIPHSVLEKTEVDEENCIMYMWTKHLDNLGGVRLLALTSPPGTFPALVKSITGVDTHFDQPELNESTRDTPDDHGFELEADPVTPQSDKKATENIQSPGNVDEQTTQPALPITPPALGESSPYSPPIVNRLTYSPNASGIESLHDRMSEASADLTSKIATMSAANLELTEDLAKKEYDVRARVDDLQQQRLLHLPHAEFTIERKLAQAQEQCDEDHEDGINYAGESMLHHDEQGLILSSAAVAVLLVVIVPWILLIGMHYLGEPTWEFFLVWASFRSIF
ncbi:hypothetical protein PINS_up002838 [Pythium insidiosum]|nr:hypothetical protein PINS_up002838 [Pythium insidiosum]